MTGQPYLCHRCTRMHNDSDLMPPCVAEMLVWNREKVVCPACKGDGSIPWLVTRKGEPTTRPCATCTPNRGWVAEGAPLAPETELSDRPEDEGFSTRGDVKWLVADRVSTRANKDYRVLINGGCGEEMPSLFNALQGDANAERPVDNLYRNDLSGQSAANPLISHDPAPGADYSLTNRTGETK